MIKAVEFPRVLIGAPKSGSGKTLITCALLRLLIKKGYKPVSYKCGPDYIDPMFHRTVLGIPSRNLDLFMMGEEGVKKAVLKGTSQRNIGVIEGVMGFYDGMSATSMEGSSCDIAKITGTLAILVVDCKGMSRSVIPLIKGYCEYGDNNPIKGIILNNISKGLSQELSPLIEEETGVPVIGYLPKLKDVEIKSRHLGLIMPEEIPDILNVIDRVADELEESFDFEAFLKIAREVKPLFCDGKEEIKNDNIDPIRIGVAKDEAFNFYYEDNLELFQEMGAEIVAFSPIHDKKLPEVAGLIFGGGYPELYAKELSNNTSMIESIRQAADKGMPVLAECGGFLYLKEGLKDPDGGYHKMAGILSGEGYMTDKLSHFGYVDVVAKADSKYLKCGESIKGHEYHYYDTTDNGDICELIKPNKNRSWMGYQINGNVFGGFAHLYYPSCRQMVERFLKIAAGIGL